MVKIDESKCNGCGTCADVCVFDVFEIKDGKAVVKNPDNCKKCMSCESVCPNGAITVED